MTLVHDQWCLVKEILIPYVVQLQWPTQHDTMSFKDIPNLLKLTRAQSKMYHSSSGTLTSHSNKSPAKLVMKAHTTHIACYKQISDYSGAIENFMATLKGNHANANAQIYRACLCPLYITCYTRIDPCGTSVPSRCCPIRLCGLGQHKTCQAVEAQHFSELPFRSDVTSSHST